VKELSKSVNICRRYGQTFDDTFLWPTVYIYWRESDGSIISRSSLSFFSVFFCPVNTITHEPLYLAW